MTASTNQGSIAERIRNLREEGRTGREIGLVFLKEGLDVVEVLQAFLQEGYVCSVQPFTADIDEFYVSDNPQKAGLATLLMVAEPCTLPSVVWSKGMRQ
jgi:hypothetical protein